MNRDCLRLPVFLALLMLVLPAAVRAGDAAAMTSELFKSLKLVYEDDFNGALNTEFWEVRQSSSWTVKEGVLQGSESSKEFQAKKLASNDPSHAGLKPVIWLRKVPENFVCSMRIRHDASAYQRGFPLFDIGHHIHTLVFSEKATMLTIKKNVESTPIGKPLFALNQWHDVVIEAKKGRLVLKVDGEKHVFESSNIDTTGHAQIDFKGVDGGVFQIDSIRLWEGLQSPAS